MNKTCLRWQSDMATAIEAISAMFVIINYMFWTFQMEKLYFISVALGVHLCCLFLPQGSGQSA